MLITRRDITAMEGRAALSKPITLTVENHDIMALVREAFRGFGEFAEMKGATTTATELKSLAEQKHDERFGHPVIRLNSVGMVIAVGFALAGFATFLAQAGAGNSAKGVGELLEQLHRGIPDDWDCGDPNCEACTKAALERQQRERRH